MSSSELLPIPLLSASLSESHRSTIESHSNIEYSEDYIYFPDNKCLKTSDISVLKNFNINTVNTLESFICNKNYLVTLNVGHYGLSNLISLCLYNNKLTSIENLPKTLEILDVSMNNLEFLDISDTKITELNISYNKFREIPDLPSTLLVLDAQSNQITTVYNLPLGLKILDIKKNLLTNSDFCNMVPNLTSLNIASNNIYELNNLPQTLRILNCTCNYISHIINLPQSIKYLYLSSNPLLYIGNFPLDLEKLWCSNTLMEKIYLPKNISFINCISDMIVEIIINDKLSELINNNNIKCIFPIKYIKNIGNESISTDNKQIIIHTSSIILLQRWWRRIKESNRYHMNIYI